MEIRKPFFNQGQPHGTIIMVAVTQDGIVMAADSRAGIPIGPSIIGGVIDEFPKIFRIKDYIISTSGEATLGGKFIGQIVSDFNSLPNEKMDFQTTILRFQDYIDNLYPISRYPESIKQGFIGAGFMNDKPQTITFDRQRIKARPQGFKSSGINANEPLILPYISRYEAKAFDCATVGSIFELAIYDFAREQGKQNVIGGPISIMKILPGNLVVWMKNDFSDNKISDMNDLVAAIKTGRVTVTPLVPDGKELVLKAIMTNKYYQK